MKISVLCPVFNAESYIKASIESILNQTYEDFELIVCEDNSNDNSLEVINSIKDSRLKVIQNDRNLGYLKTINKLFSHVQTELIAFQDADDLSHPLRFEKQIDFLKKNPDIALVGTNFNIIDKSGEVIRKQNTIENPTILSKRLLDLNPFQKPSIMFRKMVLNKIGGFREAFLELNNISEDYDWLLRASQYFQFANINYSEPLYSYRSLPSAMTKSFTDINQLFGHDVVKYLFHQRLENGYDDIDEGNLESIKLFIEELKQPFEKDSSLFFRKKVEMLMFNGLKREALQNAITAFKIKPNFSNLKLVQYCIRKSLFGI